MDKKIRSQRIEIDLPVEKAMPWVRAILQQCIKDENYQTIQTIDRVGYVHRSLADFAAELTTVTDPVTGQTVTVSGVGISLLIGAMVSEWIVADRGGVINQYEDIIED